MKSTLALALLLGGLLIGCQSRTQSPAPRPAAPPPPMADYPQGVLVCVATSIKRRSRHARPSAPLQPPDRRHHAMDADVRYITRDQRSATVLAEMHDPAVRDMAELLRDAKLRLERSIVSDERALLDTVTASTLPRWRRLIGVAADAARTMRPSTERFDRCRQLARSSLLPLLVDGPI